MNLLNFLASNQPEEMKEILTSTARFNAWGTDVFSLADEGNYQSLGPMKRGESVDGEFDYTAPISCKTY